MTAPKQDAKADQCPFCGCEPAVSEFPVDDDRTKWAAACDCRNAPEDQPYAERYVNVIAATRAEAIAAWNRRASPKGCDVELRKSDDAITLDLVLSLARNGADKAGCDGWRAQERCRQIVPLIEALINQARQSEGPPREPTPTMMKAMLYYSSADTEYADAHAMWTAAHDAWFRDGHDQTEGETRSVWASEQDAQMLVATDNADARQPEDGGNVEVAK